MRIAFLLLICLCLMACRHRKPVNEAEDQAWYAQTYEPVARVFPQGPDTALYVYDSIYRSLKNPPPIAEFGRYDFFHVVYKQLAGDQDKAVRYLDSAIRYIERHDLAAQYPQAYFTYLCMRGELALSRANYNQAHEYYLKAKQWTLRYLTTYEIATYSYNLGMLLYRQQKYAESLDYFKESMSLYTSSGKATRPVLHKQQEIADNIGLCYEKMKQYDSALFYFNKAIAIIDANKDSVSASFREQVQGVIWGNIAKIYVARDRLDTAVDLFKKSIALNARAGYDRTDAELVQAQLAGVYETQNRYADMFTVLQQLKRGLDTVPNDDALLHWKRLMASYYEHAGRPSEEIRYYKAFIHMRDSVARAEENALKTDITRQIRDKEQQLEIALLKKNNQLDKIYLLIAVVLSVIAILVTGFIYYIFRKTRRLNRLISSQKEELLQLNNVKNKLFSVVSHDMRAPVNSLSSFIYLLENRNISQESLLAYSHQLKKTLGHTSGMMENLLNWAASQMQGFQPVLERMDIRSIAEKAIDNTTGLAEEKQVTIISEIPAETMAGIDPDMLQVVLRNLLSNAVKYSHPGGLITLSAAPAGERHVAIKITDNGIGMPEEYVEKINSSNPQVLRSSSGTAREKGTGLGLYLCRIFVSMMEGSLQVESKEGKGTVFVLVFAAK
jgi:two-component system, OmpR family, sensor histidine kinase VicK